MQSLLAASPKKAPEQVKEASGDMREAADELQRAWAARDTSQPSPRQDPRPVDQMVDVGWAAFFWRLDTLASLPVELYPRAARAAKLRDRLFAPGDRLGFLALRPLVEAREAARRAPAAPTATTPAAPATPATPATPADQG